MRTNPYTEATEINFERCTFPRDHIAAVIRGKLGDDAYVRPPQYSVQGDDRNVGDCITDLIMQVQRRAYRVGRLNGFDEPAQLRDAFREIK